LATNSSLEQIIKGRFLNDNFIEVCGFKRDSYLKGEFFCNYEKTKRYLSISNFWGKGVCTVCEEEGVITLEGSKKTLNEYLRLLHYCYPMYG
jgi:hypothetical protein